MLSMGGWRQNRAMGARRRVELSADQRMPRLEVRNAADKLRRHEWRPRFTSFWTTYILFVTGYWTFGREGGTDFIGWYIMVVWTLPIVTSVRGVIGGAITARRMRWQQTVACPVETSTAMLIVVVPTIGRHDTQPALERVLRSFSDVLPTYFPHLRVDVIIEEDCEAAESIAALATDNTLMRVLTIPRNYHTPNGTRFKARANEYANALRITEGEATDTVWVLHMDDDTAVGPDTAERLVEFISEQQSAGEHGFHLTQGVLTYPRELAANRLTWLADAARPGCDISLFALSTGSGSPSAGLHGELLLVRASVEAAIGWDFGPLATVEDAEFALWFSRRYPKRCDWFSGRSYGASPATVTDFIRQRERWFSGLLRLAFKRTIPLRHRLLLLHNVILWALAPVANPGTMLLLGVLLDVNTAPASTALIPLWGINVAFSIWLYWEGLRINVASSAQPRHFRWERLSLIILLPLFLLWEMIGIMRGLLNFIQNRDESFTVIAKPR